MLGPGEHAPEFALPDHTGRVTTLAELVAHGPLLLFFYPADFTPVCTREACMFRDTYAELASAGVNVAGVSPDDVASHAKFRAAKSLDYTLLADPGKTTIAAYGLLGPLGIVRRATFLIDATATITAAVLADLRLGRHEALIRQALAASHLPRNATSDSRSTSQ